MQNKFIRINTDLGGICYINISHIVNIREAGLNDTMINTVTGTIRSKESVIELIERIYKIQWNGETKNTNSDTKQI